jgi:hypothetical protein
MKKKMMGDGGSTVKDLRVEIDEDGKYYSTSELYTYDTLERFSSSLLFFCTSFFVVAPLSALTL